MPRFNVGIVFGAICIVFTLFAVSGLSAAQQACVTNNDFCTFSVTIHFDDGSSEGINALAPGQKFCADFPSNTAKVVAIEIGPHYVVLDNSSDCWGLQDTCPGSLCRTNLPNQFEVR